MKRRSVLTSIGFGLLAQLPFIRASRAESAMGSVNWLGPNQESSSTGAKPAWQMKADYVEACSCHLFCPCYFNKHAEHPFCEFNMAVKRREGYSGNTNLAGAKDWLTGDLGPEWGTNKKGKWVVVSFYSSTTKEQPHALAPI